MTGVPDRPPKLHESVMTEVLAGILRGDHPVGGGLPREVDLAGQYDVSRYVARECIQALRDRGVLTVKHGRGTTISPPTAWNLFDDTLLAALLDGPEGAATLADALECRRIVWPEAAALAAERRVPADVGRLEDALTSGEPEFLQQLSGVAGNRFLRHVLGSLDRAVPAGDDGGGGLEAVLAAVREADPDAARDAMRRRLGAA